MELLMARVDTDTIRLLGRWQSDAMLLYLHTPDQGFTSVLSARMVQHGDYVLILPSHGGYHPVYSSLGLSQASFGVKLGTWHRIGEDSENKTCLIKQSDTCNCSM